MGKYGKYRKKYRRDWEREDWARGWLREATEEENINGSTEAYCKLCKATLRAHHSDLQKHQKSLKHRDNFSRLQPTKQKTLSNFVSFDMTKEQKTVDLKLAIYIAVHSSIRCVDHLSEILKEIGHTDIKLHRTKCSGLIKNVIAPCFFEDLLEDLGEEKYSLIVDESTDTSTLKFLCICIRYYSKRNNCIKTDFLTLLMLENGTSDQLYECIKEFFTENKINLQNIIGLGTDGANSLCGQRHSLYTLLKEDSPNLQLVRCVCHSLNNACSKASQELPACVEFLCREIFNWFVNSSNRKIDYKKTWDLINSNENGNFHNFVQIADTRWLSRFNAVNVVIEHWLELKSHFNYVVHKEKCFTARLLADMLNDESNYLFLIMLKPVLYVINNVNLIFQKNHVDIGCAYDDLSRSIIVIAKKIMTTNFSQNSDINIIICNSDNELAFRKPAQCDFGIDYYNKLKEIDTSQLKVPISEIESRVFTYLKCLLNELCMRLPNNLEYFKNLKHLSPQFALNQCKVNFRDLPFINIFVKPQDMYLCEIQWAKLHTVNWIDVCPNNDVLQNSFQFWTTVSQFKNAGGDYAFKELSSFVLCCLSLPSSNAVVERAFSIMNSIKTKFRNRMQQKMLNSIMRIKMHLYSKDICCKNFTPSHKMFLKFNSKDVYTSDTDNTDSVILAEFEL